MTWGLGLAITLASHQAPADVIAGTGNGSGLTLGERTATQLVGEPGGVGHMLILPYFSGQNGNGTMFSVINTDRVSGKVVKIRLRGASNGDSLLSLTVLMAPGDVWNGTLSQGGGALMELATADPTCIVPRIASGVPQPMSTTRLAYPLWSSADKAAQTREGYLEVINMADISPSSSNAALYNTIHQPILPAAGPACDDAVIRTAIVDTNYTTEAAAAAQGLSAPTGGLTGRWLIVNVPRTTTFSGSMYALRAVDANGVDARGNFVLFPQTGTPYAGAIDNVTADPLLRTIAYTSKTPVGVVSGATTSPVIAAALHDLPDLSTPYVAAPGAGAALDQANRLSAAMAVKMMGGEYATDPTVSAKTDWVLSMPGRRHSVAVDYATAAAPRALFSLVPATGAQYFHELNTKATASNPSQLCSGIDAPVFYDRNSNWMPAPGIGVQPARPTMDLCGVASVVSFDDAGDSAVSAQISRSNYVAYVDGWGLLNSIDPYTSMGMPLTGNVFLKVTNPAALPGVSGNYGSTFEYWLKR